MQHNISTFKNSLADTLTEYFIKTDYNTMHRYLTLLPILLLILFNGCQKEPPPELEVSASSVSVSNNNASEVVQVSSNGKWTASVSATWCTITPSSGSGNAEITIQATSNLTDDQRSASMVVTSGNLKRTVIISQGIATLDVSDNVLQFVKESSSKQVYVSTNTNWAVVIPASDNWVSVSPLAGTQSGNISITVSANQGYKRNATIALRYGTREKTIVVTQERSINSPPNQPQLSSPVNSLTDANRLPTFRWRSATDPDGDEVSYRIDYSKNQSNWTNSSALTDTVYNLSQYLDANSTYYWRVAAVDNYGGESFSEVRSFTTGVKESYFDGEYKVAFENSKGLNPSQIIFMGDGYISDDYEEGGQFDTDINAAIGYFFDVEPYKSYKEYFKVYKMGGYSRDRGVRQSDRSINKNTLFVTDFLGGSSMSIDYDKVFEYARKIPGMTSTTLRNVLIIMVVNQDRYAGTCWIWTDGRAIAIAPVSRSTQTGQHFRNLIHHEAGGHGFGRLADEYISSGNVGKTIDAENLQRYNNFKNAGFYPNVDITGDSTAVKWRHFFGVEGYSRVGIYQGAFYFSLGVWRPESSSCMQFNEPYFNAPSREFMVRRILTNAGEEFAFDAFVSGDIERAPSLNAVVQTKSINPLTFIPLAPPVLVK